MRMKKVLPILIAFVAFFVGANAQITTSSMSGVIKNKSGNPLPGSTITAVHIPTGSVYTAQSRSGGRFDINNMNPGGPYTVTVSFVGFETDKKEDVFLSLGETQTLNVSLFDKSTH